MNKKPLTKFSIFNLLKKIKRFNLGSENILLDRSINRFLNKDIKSKINLPPFNNSAVDGYAQSGRTDGKGSRGRDCDNGIAGIALVIGYSDRDSARSQVGGVQAGARVDRTQTGDDWKAVGRGASGGCKGDIVASRQGDGRGAQRELKGNLALRSPLRAV